MRLNNIHRTYYLADMNNRVAELIRSFSLQPHPEGGFYARQFESQIKMQHPAKANAIRPLYTSIYFLMTSTHHSSWHRLSTDEMWHFYEGDPVHIHLLHSSGAYQVKKLCAHGTDICFQWVVPAGVWFAVSSEGSLGYSFTGCSLAPGFDFDDFELADASDLQSQFPAHQKIIDQFKRSI
jgi:predicted cupin superfamily sugar epimerase